MRGLFVVACLASSARADPDPPFQAPPEARSFLALGLGLARHHTDAGIVDPAVFTFQFGQRLADHLSLVEAVDFEFAGGVMPDAQHATARLGLRWFPFDPDRGPRMSPRVLYPGRIFDMTALHLQADIGVDTRDNSTDASVKTIGGLIEASIGYLPFQGYDYAYGLVFSTSFARFGAELQHEYTLMFVAEVY